MGKIVRNRFHSSRLTFKTASLNDIDAMARYLEKDKGGMLSWFGMDDLESSEKNQNEKAKTVIGVYKRNTRPKKHMLHICKKHTQEIIGVANIWTDIHGNKRVAVYLTPSERRKKYGSETQKTVLREIERLDSKIQFHVAQVDKGNVSSIKNFCSLGFKIVGARRFSSPKGSHENLDLTLMRPRFR